METINITIQEAVRMIQDSNGKIFKATFLKRTEPGKVREMTCRTEVKKGIKGIGSSYDPKTKNLIQVYAMEGNKSGFRCFGRENLLTMTMDGKVYKVNHPTV